MASVLLSFRFKSFALASSCHVLYFSWHATHYAELNSAIASSSLVPKTNPVEPWTHELAHISSPGCRTTHGEAVVTHITTPFARRGKCSQGAALLKRRHHVPTPQKKKVHLGCEGNGNTNVQSTSAHELATITVLELVRTLCGIFASTARCSSAQSEQIHTTCFAFSRGQRTRQQRPQTDECTQKAQATSIANPYCEEKTVGSCLRSSLMADSAAAAGVACILAEAASGALHAALPSGGEAPPSLRLASLVSGHHIRLERVRQRCRESNEGVGHRKSQHVDSAQQKAPEMVTEKCNGRTQRKRS